MEPLQESPAPQPGLTSSTFRWIAVAVVAIVVAYPLVTRFLRSQPAGAVEQTSTDLLGASMAAYQSGNYDLSIGLARQILQKTPGSAAALNNIAAALAQQKKFDEALPNAEAAVKADPAFALAKNNLKWIQDERAKVAPAGTTGAKDAGYYLSISAQQYNSRQFTESIVSARHAIALDAKLAEAWNNIAAASAELGRADDAIAAGQEAVKLKPDFQLAKNNLKWAMDLKAKAGK